MVKIHSITVFSLRLIKILTLAFLWKFSMFILIKCAGYCCSSFYTSSALSNSSMSSLSVFFQVDHLWSLNFRFHFLSQLSGHRSYSCLMPIPQLVYPKVNSFQLFPSLFCHCHLIALASYFAPSYSFPTVSHDANFHVAS